MKIMKKCLTGVLALTMLAGMTIGGTSCAEVIEEIDESKTQLYVANYNGGAGFKWLDGVVERFEEKYAETSFESGKKGVQVIVDHSKAYTGASTTTNLPTSKYEVFFANSFAYFDAASSGMLLDISDLVTETVNDEDGKKIYDKLSDVQKSALKVNGKYYGIPHSELYDGISYDAGIFKEKNLYFSNRLDESDTTYPGTSEFIRSAADTKSCGPDGISGNYDDGLPSSFQEFYKLMDRMHQATVTPFVFAGGHAHYTNKLLISFYESYVGAEAMSVNFDFDSNGEEVEIVTGWKGEKPVLTKMALTKDNANKIRSSAGLYYATELCERVFSDSRNYNKDMANSTATHLDAMEKFMKSGLDGEKYCAMFIDGNYWYSEAVANGIMDDVKQNYPDTYTKKEVRFMPLPHQYEGRVTEGKGKPPVLIDTYFNYAFINSTTPENHQEAAKKFLSFIYSDEELVQTTKVSNGIAKAVKYDLSSLKNTTNSFEQSLFEIRDAAMAANSLLTAISDDDTFKYNQATFSLVSTSLYFESNGQRNVYSAFDSSNPPSAKEYFLGFAMSDTVWNSQYNK